MTKYLLQKKEEATEEPDEVEEKPDKPQLFTVKVDGVEKEVASDELIKNYQLASASHDRFRKANELDQQARTAIKSLAENPFGTL